MSTGRRVKEGILRRYKKNMLGGKWKECKAVLYEDSTFVWYEMGNESDPEGVLNLKQVAPFFAVGVYTTRLPNRPQLPSGSKIEHALAFGTGPSKEAKIFWFLCHNDDDLNAWMSSIVTTLPPPPQPPQQQQQHQPMPPPAYNQGAQPPAYYPGQPGGGGQPLPPPPAWAQNMNYPRPQAAQAAQGHTTVVVAPSSYPSSSSGWGSTAAGVGTGMLVGGLTGYALGSMMTPHWGHGYGYGGGWGGGYGYGPGGGGYYSDNDTTIVNNYNNTTNDTNTFNDSGTYQGGGDDFSSGDNFDYGGGDGGGFDDGGFSGGDDFDFGGDMGGGDF